MIAEDPPSQSRSNVATLGGLLYTDKIKIRISEGEWVELVQSVAAGDQFALRSLFDRTHRLVFTLIMRITKHRATAEELTVEVFSDVRRRAATYDPADSTVVAWLMNHARSLAIEDPRSSIAREPEVLAGLETLTVLAPDERDAIEGAFFSGLTCAEFGARLDQPREAVEARIRSGLAKIKRKPDAEASGAGCATGDPPCNQAERVPLYAVQALDPSEMSSVGAHIPACTQCQNEFETLHPVLDAFASWPVDLLRPPSDLWARLARRIVEQSLDSVALGAGRRRPESEWEQVAPGISCKLLATDNERHRVSMLVRLAPGVPYPAHRHAGREELHLLHGELWIDGRKLYPGDYNRAEAGTSDAHVWSETGCTCVLVTSPLDVLG
jgi:DNA-directed RNA polymerase specialized sigma24 family protein/quercetin dioxygenase-like cupin family protein